MAPGAGTNSLYELTGLRSAIATEEVTTTTLDAYTDHAGLGLLTLVKVDTEGHDLSVLRGAQKLFAEKRILAAQFEYNNRWIASRSFLRDAFELLIPSAIAWVKLTPKDWSYIPAGMPT